MSAAICRRALLAAGLALPVSLADLRSLAAQTPEPPLGPPEPFSFERLIVRARETAAKPFEARPEAPSWLGDLAPDQYDRIRYKPEQYVWSGQGPFALELLPLGSYWRQPVRISFVENGQARTMLYSPDLFDFGGVNLPDTLPPDAGFAGLSVHHTPAEGLPVELLTFKGGSYFRAIGRGTRAGLSARGLALDTGLGRPEEFPVFTDLWVFKPSDPAAPLEICALLDSPRVTGAYRFDVSATDVTVIDVDASLFFRADVEQVGLAPLTSMFLFGRHHDATFDDYRPEVHNSDGLAIWRANGEVLWRPIVNPADLRMSVFVEENMRGFGLLQRQRDFTAYEDLDARYDLRPNLWVEPRGEWGQGSIRLIEIPSAQETHDNIVAFWTPNDPVTAGRELRVAYSLRWTLQPPLETGLARIVGTLIGKEQGDGSGRHIVIEVDAPDGTNAESPVPDAVVTCHNGECTAPVVRWNEPMRRWRVTFDVTPGKGAVELRCFLEQGGKPISETWLYRLDTA